MCGTFELVAGLASIFSFLISIYTLGQVVQIRNNFQVKGDFLGKGARKTKRVRQSIKGNRNFQVGGDSK